jgi:hypothetical protein
MKVSVTGVHEYSCPYWRTGTRHGPCRCGALDAASAVKGKIEQALQALDLSEIGPFIEVSVRTKQFGK